MDGNRQSRGAGNNMHWQSHHDTHERYQKEPAPDSESRRQHSDTHNLIKCQCSETGPCNEEIAKRMRGRIGHDMVKAFATNGSDEPLNEEVQAGSVRALKCWVACWLAIEAIEDGGSVVYRSGVRYTIWRTLDVIPRGGNERKTDTGDSFQ